MIRAIICGAYGKMGRLTAKCAEKSEDITVCAGVDFSASEEALPFPVFSDIKSCPKADCVIDFSSPDAIFSLTEYCQDNGLPLISAVTGHNFREYEAIQKASEHIPVFYSSNFSKGITALKMSLEAFSNTLGESFDVSIYEAHHRYKKDSPSGTALMLKEELQRLGRRDVNIASVRGGGITGEHTVMFMSDCEVIEITHRALCREAFALGALDAVRLIIGKKPGIYSKTVL